MGLDNPGLVGGIRDAGLLEEPSDVVLGDPVHVVRGAPGGDDMHVTGGERRRRRRPAGVKRRKFVKYDVE